MAKKRLDREIDFERFVRKQRVFASAVIALLTRRQRVFVDKLGQAVLEKSSFYAETESDSSHDEINFERSDNRISSPLLNNEVDKRLKEIARLELRVKKSKQKRAP